MPDDISGMEKASSFVKNSSQLNCSFSPHPIFSRELYSKSQTDELNQKSNHSQIPCILARYFQAKSNVVAEKYISHVSFSAYMLKKGGFAEPRAILVLQVGSSQPSCHWSHRSRA